MAGDSRHILRGGYGIYYDFPYTNATVLFPASAVQSDYRIVYFNEDPNGIRNANGTFFRPGIDPLPPNQGGSSQPPTNIAQKSWQTPQSTQLSLGYSWQTTDWLGLTFDAVHIKYDNIPFRFRANPKVNGTRIIPTASANTRLWVGDGSATYKGFNIGFHARASRFESQGFYTWSKANGNVLTGADEFRLWDGSLQSGPQTNALVNPLDPYSSASFGPLYTDARHRVTLSTTYQGPLGINASGIFRFRSGIPYTGFYVAGNDLAGTGYTNQLAPGVSHVNSFRGASSSQLDVRLAKDFGIGGGRGIELIGEIFNLLNSKNATRPNGSVYRLNATTGKPELNPTFGQPTVFAGDPGQGEQRLAQLGLRVHF